jgi:alkylation response protein AidB-like acyl-CoA dehydrogenase
MEFTFTEEQLMIQDMAASFVDEVSTSEAIRRAMVSDAGYDPAVWQRITEELCWQALPVDEADGGLGLGMVELVAMLEQTGRRLLCSPFFATVCLALLCAKRCPASEAKQTLIEAVLAGQTATLVHTDSNGRWDNCAGLVSFKDNALTGSAGHVLNGETADWLVVAAREEDGVALFLVPGDAPQLQRRARVTMDQTRRLADVRFEGVPALHCHRLCSFTQGGDVVNEVLEFARIGAAAEMVGVAQHALESSVAYIQERVQFGRAIATFQAVKHKCADVMVKVESSRSALYYAACVADEYLAGRTSLAALQEAASIANAYASEASFFAAGTGIQLHGGVGITAEYDIQLFFKRARALESYLGLPHWHRERIAAMLLGDSDV